MISTLFLFTILTLGNSQIFIPQSNTTLAQLSSNSSNLDSFQGRAVAYLLNTHPRLENFSVVVINNLINRRNQAHAENLKDALFQLNSPSIRIRVLVTLSTQFKQNFISLSPIVSSQSFPQKAKSYRFAQYSILSEDLKEDNESINTSITNQQLISNGTIDINSTNPQKPSQTFDKLPLNSYIQYQNYEDPLAQLALGYVASKHPNIINYHVEAILYQLVAGLNIKIYYLGDDNFTSITAIVNIDLKFNPSLFLFEVECTIEDSYCNSVAAARIYQSIESILIFHPELFAYRVVGFLVKEEVSSRIKVMITFQESEKKLRTLVEEQVSAKKLTILSFYSYSYSQ